MLTSEGAEGIIVRREDISQALSRGSSCKSCGEDVLELLNHASLSMATAQITKGCCCRLDPLGEYVQALLDHERSN